MSDKKNVEQQVINPFKQLTTQLLHPSDLSCRQTVDQPVRQVAKNQQYQNELQQQRLRNLAAELNAISDPAEKMQFIENRLLENLQHLKRQLAILQQGVPSATAGIASGEKD